MELRALDVRGRSTLYVSREGALYRFYHDTERWDGPLPPTIDARGAVKCMGNRCLATAVADAFAVGAEEGYRGVRRPPPSRRRPPPPCLRRALAHLVALRGTVDIATFARKCNVEVSTAWNYAARVVEEWPRAHVAARRLVYPPLLAAIDGLADRRGTLREVMARLGMEGDSDWRCVRDRFAHLRLARLCAEARQAEEEEEEEEAEGVAAA